MGEILQTIEKYKARLNPEFEFKKVFRALQKLNELEMTIELLRATGIAKAVGSLRKKEGFGDFAKEIVNKWKRLFRDATAESEPKNKSYVRTPVKSEPVEYDPTQNWEMSKSTVSPYQPNVKHEKRDDDEYEPSLNWKAQRSSKHSSNAYVPSPSPVKFKQEKDANVKQKKKKRRENGRASEMEINKEASTSREAELVDKLRKTQEELVKIKKEKNKKSIRVKEEKESPDRNSGFQLSMDEDDVEEYDPQCNYGLEQSSTYDPGSNSVYEPSSQDESMEYDPGPADSSYQPMSVTNPSPRSRVSEQEGDDSFDEDEPGAYLLHPRRASAERLRSVSVSGTDGGQFEAMEPSCVMSSTTLYSRNKSVDSEDGTWGSQGDEGHRSSDKGHLPCISEFNSEPNPQRTNKNVNKQLKHSRNEIPEKLNKSSRNSEKHKSLSTKAKETTKDSDLVKCKREKSTISKDKVKSNHKTKNDNSSVKRKSTGAKAEEPAKKKSKNVENIKLEKHVPKDAGFLFEDLPDASKAKKKKKKKSSNESQPKRMNSASSSQKPNPPRLDLHLPQIQTTYRPLPHSEKADHRPEGLTDNQAAELHSTRQTKKMLVYSGGGGGFIPKMMSLFDQCMSVLMNNIDAMDVIGGIPFEIIKPVLERCTPEQLYRLEDSNPYLLEETDPLWKQHARSEFKGRQPDEMELWREMYLRLHDEREAKLLNLTQIIQAKEAKKKPLEKKVLLAYVGTSAKAPRNVRRAQEKYGTGVKTKFQPRSSGSSAAAVREEVTRSRMSVPVGSITAASVERENRFSQMREKQKPRVAPMMAKTLKSIGRLKFKR